MSTEFLLNEANWPLLQKLSHYKGTYSMRNIIIQLNKMRISINPAILSQVYPQFGRVQRIRHRPKKDRQEWTIVLDESNSKELGNYDMKEKIRQLMILSIHSKVNMKLMTNDWLKSKNNLVGYNVQSIFHKHCKEMLIQIAQLFVKSKTRIKRIIRNKLSFEQIQAFMRLRENELKSDKAKQIGQSAVLMSRLFILLCEHQEEDRTQLYDRLSKEVNKQLVEQAFNNLNQCFYLLDIIRKEKQNATDIEITEEDKDLVKYLKYYYETERKIEPQQMKIQSEFWRIKVVQQRNESQNNKTIQSTSRFMVYDYAEAENKQRSAAKLIISQIENKMNHLPDNN